MSETLLSVQNLVKAYGTFKAVDDLSFSLRKGEILGLLGPNGAGKTTTIRMLMGLHLPSAGTISLFDGTLPPGHPKLKRRLGYMSQKCSLYPLLTAQENLAFFGGLFGMPRTRLREERQQLEAHLGQEHRRTPVQELPPGLRQVTALQLCLMTDPELIVLDEPTSGVDPQVRRDFWQTIYRLKEAGKTLIVSTHNLDEVSFTDRLILMHHGRLVLDGPLEDLLTRWQQPDMEGLFITALKSAETREEVTP